MDTDRSGVQPSAWWRQVRHDGSYRDATAELSLSVALVGAGAAQLRFHGAIILVPAAGLLIVCLIQLLRGRWVVDSSRLAPWLAVGLSLSALVVLLGSEHWVIASLPLMAALVVVGSLRLSRVFPADSVLVAAGLLLVVLPLVLVPTSLNARVIDDPDVLEAHHAAGEALVRGENPYVVVRVEDTNPFMEGDVWIEGYPYPPASMLPFALASVAGPAGLLTVASLSALGIMVLAITNRSKRPASGVTLTAMVVGYPGAVFMAFVGSTDPWSLVLFGGAAAVSRRSWVASAVLFGFGAASKQYLWFAILAVLLSQIHGRVRYTAVACAAGAATFLPWLLANPRALVDSIVVTDRWMARPDALSLAAAGIVVPSWLILGGLLALLAIVGRRVESESGLYLLLALGMAFVSVLSPQSVTNYWFNVVAFAVLALATAVRDDRSSASPRWLKSEVLVDT